MTDIVVDASGNVFIEGTGGDFAGALGTGSTFIARVAADGTLDWIRQGAEGELINARGGVATIGSTANFYDVAGALSTATTVATLSTVADAGVYGGLFFFAGAGGLPAEANVVVGGRRLP